MGWQKPASSSSRKTHIRILFAITVFVALWFFMALPSSSDTYYGRLNVHGSSRTPPSKKYLPMAEAKDYCEQRRWKPYPYRHAPRKIYDLVMINTELEWLEIRMGQMDADVDYFVVLESNKTFTDKDKPCHVRENYGQFKKYHHKMILHTLEIPDKDEEGGAWSREALSRNAMYSQILPKLTGEQEVLQGDIILVSDVDELPRPDALKALRNCDFPKEVTLHTKIYYYGFQWLARNDWPHPQATFYNGEDTVLPDNLRSSNGDDLYNAGWHCSFCFPTVAELVTKIKSFSHTEFDREDITDRDTIVQRVRKGMDIFGREESHYDRLEDGDIPGFLISSEKNKRRYSYMLNRDGPEGGFWDYNATDVKLRTDKKTT